MKETPMAKSEDGETSAESGGAAETDRVILVICPTHRDHRELPLVSPPGIKYLFHDYASTSLEDLICEVASHADFTAGPLEEIDAILAKIAGVRLAAVISTDDYPGSALAAAIAKQLGLPAPDPAVTLICQHKYLARLAQRNLADAAVLHLIDVARARPSNGWRSAFVRREISSRLARSAHEPSAPRSSTGRRSTASPRDVSATPARHRHRRRRRRRADRRRLVRRKATIISVVDW
jgi:hypothetical protein